MKDLSKSETMGGYLASLRKQFNYSQEYVACQLGLTRQAYSHYETNRVQPTTTSLFQLADLYQIPIDKFQQYVNGIKEKSSTSKISRNFLIEEQHQDEYKKYLSNPENTKRLKHLSPNEKHFLFYFQQLSPKEQNDFLLFLKIKAQHNFDEKEER